MEDKGKIRVAIIGGGLAGASLLFGLLKYPHLDVHIFESAPAFKERGTGINVLKNASAALQHLGALACLERAGAVTANRGTWMLAEGPRVGQIVGEMSEPGFSRKVHRARFLHELLRDTPNSKMHASKKLTSVVEHPDHLLLNFEDSSSHICDILVGADGVWSQLRSMVLGESDPASKPVYAGWYTVWQAQPSEKMREKVGAEYFDPDDPQQYYWIGNGSYLQHDLLSQGTLATCIAAIKTKSKDWHGETWGKPAEFQEVREAYQNWPSHLRDGMIELMLSVEKPIALPQWEHPHASTFIKGRICLIGDAAHTTTPWQGSGGGMSMEDALILSTVLGRCDSPSQAEQALKVYDQLRRPRTQRVVDSSREVGILMTGSDPDIRLDPEKLYEALKKRYSYILDFDIGRHRNEALMTLEETLKH